MKGLLARKLGMTQLFNPDGTTSAVTVLEAGPCKVLGLRTTDGMDAPLGFDSELDELVQAGLIERRGARIVPTRRGMDLHNQVALVVL